VCYEPDNVLARSLSAKSFATALAVWFALAGAASADPVLTPPEVASATAGTWPAGDERAEGATVALLVTVEADGSVRDAAPEPSGEPGLVSAAVEAVKAWRFVPARKDGVAVAARARVLVQFPAQPSGTVTAEPNNAARPASEAVTRAAESAATSPPSAPVSYGAQARAEAPPRSASETVRRPDVLMAAPHRTGSDLLVTVPGMFVTQHSGEGKAHQLFYRGFDAGHGQDVEVWVAGAPVNEVSNIHGQGYADLHFVIPEAVRTLRALPGSYDPRQGDFAVAGTMRYELGLAKPGLLAKGSYGSFGTQRYVLGARPRGGSEQAFVAAELYTTDGFGPSRAARRASALAQYVLRLPEDVSLRVMLGGYAGHFDSAGVLRLSDLSAGTHSRFSTYDPTQGGASQRGQLVVELRGQDRRSTLAVTPYLVLRSLRLRQNFTGSLLDPSGDASQQLNSALTVGGSAFYRRHQTLFSPSDALEIGLSARSDWIEQSQVRLAALDNRVTADEVEASVRATNVGAYVDAALHPHTRVTVRGGVRLDGLAYLVRDEGAKAAGQARSSQGAHVGPKASLQVRAVPGWLDVIASYGEGFRSPQARSLAQSETTPFTRVRSTELGLRVDRGPITASVAGFYTWLSDDLVFDPATTRNERVPATGRSGATVDVTAHPRHDVLVSAHGTYTHAVFRRTSEDYHRGDLVPYAPQLVGRVDLAYRPALGEWKERDIGAQLGLGASGLAKRPLPYSLYGHDFVLVDAQAGLRWGEVSLMVSAFNLFDARWYDGEFLYASRWDRDAAASLVPIRHVTVGAPRTVLGTLEVSL
jgi:iron complex outermembrane recepter protein